MAGQFVLHGEGVRAAMARQGPTRGRAGVWCLFSLVSLLVIGTAAVGDQREVTTRAEGGLLAEVDGRGSGEGTGRSLLSSNFAVADKIIIGTSQSLSPSLSTGGGLNTADYILG